MIDTIGLHTTDFKIQNTMGWVKSQNFDKYTAQEVIYKEVFNHERFSVVRQNGLTISTSVSRLLQNRNIGWEPKKEDYDEFVSTLENLVLQHGIFVPSVNTMKLSRIDFCKNTITHYGSVPEYLGLFSKVATLPRSANLSTYRSCTLAVGLTKTSKFQMYDKIEELYKSGFLDTFSYRNHIHKGKLLRLELRIHHHNKIQKVIGTNMPVTLKTVWDKEIAKRELLKIFKQTFPLELKYSDSDNTNLLMNESEIIRLIGINDFTLVNWCLLKKRNESVTDKDLKKKMISGNVNPRKVYRIMGKMKMYQHLFLPCNEIERVKDIQTQLENW